MTMLRHTIVNLAGLSPSLSFSSRACPSSSSGTEQHQSAAVCPIFTGA